MLARVPLFVWAAWLAAAAPCARAQDGPLNAGVAVQSRQVYVGQQFLLQIQIEGTDRPDPLDVRPLERDFDVTEAGGGASNSTSVSIVNGRMTRQVRRGYNLNYRLAAKAEGEAVVPSLTITASGRSARTQPLQMQVLPPQENDDFKLRLSLSDTRAYVGQPLTLTATWYIGREVQEFSFTMPLLDDRRLDVLDPPASGQAQDDLIKIPLGNRQAAARQEVGELGGRRYPVLQFEKVLVPRVAGSIDLSPSTVTFVTPKPGPSRRRDPFDDLFSDSFFSGVFGSRRELETLAIPSNRVRLEVLDLPVEGRPVGFNGWIGQFQLGAEAKPTAVAVGEPITLDLTVRGDGILESAAFPALNRQPALARDFNVPREIGAGEGGRSVRSFTQTLRAKHDGVTRVPAIELPYFDPKEGAYRIARSEPIPLEVEPSRIVTVEDAEGRGATGPRQLEVESSSEGLAHNFVDSSALVSMPGGWGAWLRPLGPLPFAIALLALPPLVFLGAVAVRLGGSLRALGRLRARSPGSRWRSAASAIDPRRDDGRRVAEAVLSGLREYLGARFGGAPSESAAWTFGDVKERLGGLASGSDGKTGLAAEELLVLLRGVFERCEAGTYAGVQPMDESARRQLVADASQAVERIEEALR